MRLEDGAQKIEDYRKAAENSVRELLELGEEMGMETEAAKKQTMRVNIAAASLAKSAEWIKDIADRAELLALNASIEAAKAGEDGDRFGMAASEMRSLAEECAQYAQNMTDTIRSLAEDARQSTERIHAVGNAVEAQNGKLAQSMSVFQGFNGEMLSLGGQIAMLLTQTNTLLGAVEELQNHTTQSEVKE